MKARTRGVGRGEGRLGWGSGARSRCWCSADSRVGDGRQGSWPSSFGVSVLRALRRWRPRGCGRLRSRVGLRGGGSSRLRDESESGVASKPIPGRQVGDVCFEGDFS